jgi:hypothetical protein
MLAYLVVLSFLNLINVCGVGFSIAVFFKERKKERIFISQPQHDRYYMIYSKHSKQVIASEREKIHHRTIYRQDWVERDCRMPYTYYF